MGLNPLEYRYAVISDTDSDPNEIPAWIRNKRVKTINVTCGASGGALVVVTTKFDPLGPGTQIGLGTNESLHLCPDGAGIVSLSIQTFGTGVRWLVDAWELPT